MSWLWLSLAILCEVPGTIAMKYSEGFSKLIPSIIMLVCYGLALAFVSKALEKIELSVAYTIWAGVGTTLVALVGIFYFGEQITWLKMASIGLVIIGVMGLKYAHS